MADDGESFGSFDVMVKGEKKGVAFDTNPCVVETDEQCLKELEQLLKDLPLTETEAKLIKQCMSVATADDDEDVLFGPGELLDLAVLTGKYPDKVTQILACSNHLLGSIDCEGDMPDGIFLKMADMHGELGSLMSRAVKAGPGAIPDSDSDDDQDDEEDGEDEEEDTTTTTTNVTQTMEELKVADETLTSTKE